jgi:hypothetical protein
LIPRLTFEYHIDMAFLAALLALAQIALVSGLPAGTFEHDVLDERAITLSSNLPVTVRIST